MITLKDIDRMLARRKERGKANVEAWGGKDATAESVMRWWLEDEIDETWVSMFEEEML